MCNSFSAKRRPMHIRRPYPNGRLTNGWIFWPACGQPVTSPAENIDLHSRPRIIHSKLELTQFAAFDPTFWQKAFRFGEIFGRMRNRQMWEYYVGLKFENAIIICSNCAPKRNTKLTPLGTWKPLMTASDCKFLPLPITTGYNLKWCNWNEKAWST